ncbi:MAG TPA: primosomal protein N' [Candidatus Onthocola stercoravium]|nr:primosomal protein N' [Candidatus Onthocola stercoravium]
MYANVIIEYGVKALNKTFIYKIPEELKDKIKVGMKVYVPFGKMEVFGFVMEIVNSNDTEYDAKEIIRIDNEELVLSKELMDVGKYLSSITLCTLITAYQTMLPSSLKIKKQEHNYDKFDEYLVLTDKLKAMEYICKYPRRMAQIKAINNILEVGKLNKKEVSSEIVKALEENGIITIEKVSKYRINKGSDEIVKKTLTEDQERVYKSVDFNKYDTYLLYGVTGSGKTEVYIKWIEKCISEGKTAIMLVPEISLTTQIAKRFYEAFGSDVAIFHSSLSEGEKYDEYLKILRGEVHVVVGTRSAIFVPFTNLGIIIIDEEDSSSYKQDNNPRYHARDIAIYRGKYNNIPVLLGSATPTLESKARADKGVYKLLKLSNRVGNAKLPIIHVIDMEGEMKKRNLIFSEFLQNKIREKLIRKEQVILLLNRRGFSTFITCSNCGYTYKCPSCDITLTFHKSTNNLICHYCGYQKKKDEVCPECHEASLNYYGLGTERLEEKIKEMYPDARVVRMDQDTTRNKGSHEKIIGEFKEYKYDILLGTQMISKGLDFPKVTLVGVINADASLNIPDYRSSEVTYSLLSQVAGRAGRSEMPGEVIIQTFNPDNYVIECVKSNNYDKFYLQEMNFRKKLKYPPYYYLVGIKVIGKVYEKTIEDARKVKKYLDDNLNKETIVLGPTTASVFRFNNEYRMQIIIKYKFDDKLMATLKDLDNIFSGNKDNYLEIDFNPLRI